MHIMGWVKCQHRVGESGVIPNIFAGENISRIHWWIKAKSFKQCFLLFGNFCSQRLWCWKGNSQVTSTSQIHFCQGIAIFWGDFPILFWRCPGGIPCLLLPRRISAGIFLLNKPCIFSVLSQRFPTELQGPLKRENLQQINPGMTILGLQSSQSLRFFCSNFGILICHTFFCSFCSFRWWLCGFQL